MFSSILEFLKKLVFGVPLSNNEETSPIEEKKPFSIDHEWPFPSPRPPNEEYLVGELIKGVQKEGDHVFFFWNGQKRRHIRTPQGTETVLAKHIVWWLEGRRCPTGSLVTKCGEQKCIRIDHLILKQPQVPYGPLNRDRTSVPTPRATRSSRPQPPKIKKGNSTKLTRFTKEDRNKCITRKVFFATEAAANRYAREINKPEVRGTGPRQYSYPCTQGCGGYHMTKIDPKKFGKKKVGSW